MLYCNMTTQKLNHGIDYSEEVEINIASSIAGLKLSSVHNQDVSIL